MLKAALATTLVCGCVTFGVQKMPPAPLREEISNLLEKGRTDEAIRRVQDAVRQHPTDAATRAEFVELHMSLARSWVSRRRFDDSEAALRSVLSVDAKHAGARSLLDQITSAREKAAGSSPQIDQLLRIELFEPALARIDEAKKLRPDRAAQFADQERAAWLGAADDHYLARNFNEAFALYERLVALDPNAPADIHSRWVVSLALALAEDESEKPASTEATGRLLARAIDVLKKTNEPVLGQIIGGLLAHRAGQLNEAGRAYSQALGDAWSLPQADRRKEAVDKLRKRSVTRARELYEAIQPARRGGLWAIALQDTWKNRKTPHFDVYARSDLIAERIAEALEFHFSAIARWLDLPSAGEFSPLCEVRVYEDLERLHQETGTSGVTRAVSRTRLQGGQVLSRLVSVFQSDHWLLSSTLPHELTHVLVAEKLRRQADESARAARAAQESRAPDTAGATANREAPPEVEDQHAEPNAASGGIPVAPLALDEGLAVQAEPAARRLQYRRLLNASPPTPDKLLESSAVKGDQLTYYAQCDCLTEFLLQRGGLAELIDFCASNNHGSVDARFGWSTRTAMLADWREWCRTRRTPARMPLMILSEPGAEQRKK